MAEHTQISWAGEMSEPRPDDELDWMDETDECWECGGQGGWNSCMEDTCCAIGGEEGCDDPICWRVCPNCKGTGVLK